MHRICVFVAVCSVWAWSPWAIAADRTQASRVVAGERLDPATFGPGIVESAAEALARDRERAARGEPDRAETRWGVWMVPSVRATYYPHSGRHNLTNKWGDTKMGVAFPTVVDVHGVYIAGQGGRGVWTTGVRVLGYRHGREVAATQWFREIGDVPIWFEMGLRNVDRIVIEAEAVTDRSGWYALDDLTYTRKPGQGLPATIVLDFEDCNYKQKLTGSGYAGLIWEVGTGGAEVDGQVMPAPVSVPDDEEGVLPGPEAAGAGLRGSATTPELINDFIGAGYTKLIPPDTCGAVGPAHFAEIINGRYRVFDKETGSTVQDMSLATFIPGGYGDPRILYDQYSDRWIALDTDFGSRIYLNVSMTSDPTGSWFKTYFEAAQGSDAGRLVDYPTLGVDANGVYTTCAMFSTRAPTYSIFAIEKAPLIAATPSLGTVTAWRGYFDGGSIQPAHTYGTAPGEYLISRTGSTSLTLRRIGPPLFDPSLTELGTVTIANHFSPPNCPALGSSTPLDALGHRTMNAVYRDGSLWTTHAVYVGEGRAGARWYEIDVATRNVIQWGTVSDPVRGYIFPSIMVNRRGDVALGFSGASASQYAAAYYTGRLSVNPPGEMGPVAELKAGETWYNQLDGYGRNRWGDYSLCSLDPVDETTIWTIQEYASVYHQWGTWIGVLSYFRDCNSNGIDDEEDINAETSADDNGDGIPDECQRLYVDDDAGGANNGTSWSDAYTDLQDALARSLSLPGVVLEIWVADGAYPPAGPGGDRAATFKLPRGMVVYGGFAGWETLLEERDLINNRSVLSGDLNGDDGPGFVNNGENSYHVVTLSTNGFGDPPVIDGCTIAGGNADGSWPDNAGGGVFSESLEIVLRNCIVRSNAASLLGGGLFQYSLGDCTLVNCLFAGNTADDGGAVYSDLQSVTVINSSFSGNTAGDRAGGVYCGGGGLIVSGSIFWGNTAISGSTEDAQLYVPVGTVDVNYSCVEGWSGDLGGAGNIGTDPSFADADGADNQFGTADDDLHLQSDSPCIDAGDNAAVPGGVTTDLDLHPRFLDDPNTADTGNGTAPIVDMGAYEYQGCSAVAVRSFKDHASIGELPLDLSDGGIEPRVGSIEKLEIDLDDAGGFGGLATVDCQPTAWSGSITPSTNGDTVTLEFNPALPGQVYCRITLDCGAEVCVRVCEGDMNRSGSTDTTDASSVKARFGQTTTGANCEWDFNCSGAIDTSDAAQVKPRFGFTAPQCP